MKSLTVGLLAAVLMVGAILAAGQARAWSYTGGATIAKCSGTNDYFGGHYYADTYQWVEVRDNTVRDEQHAFTFGGFLTGFESAGRLDVWNTHVTYRMAWRDIAVPTVPGEYLLVRDNRYAKNDPNGQWVTLC
ncbi:hypothetical protein [Nocardia sp. NPDC052566]|uniref:hypothetical protein n=1 Tax=Nocardia sp. NPDC052566 TaxID=3364330 RepID=UPI0037C8B4AF